MNLIELHERYLKSELTLRRIAATPPRAVEFLVGPINLPVAGRLSQNHQKPPFFSLKGGGVFVHSTNNFAYESTHYT
jgi:hypothetical protein